MLVRVAANRSENLRRVPVSHCPVSRKQETAGPLLLQCVRAILLQICSHNNFLCRFVRHLLYLLV